MMWLEVDPTPGDSIDDAAREAIALVHRMGVGIRFRFNGIRCHAKPNGTAAAIVAHYEKESKRPDSPWKHVNTINDRLAAIERRLDAADPVTPARED